MEEKKSGWFQVQGVLLSVGDLGESKRGEPMITFEIGLTPDWKTPEEWQDTPVPLFSMAFKDLAEVVNNTGLEYPVRAQGYLEFGWRAGKDGEPFQGRPTFMVQKFRVAEEGAGNGDPEEGSSTWARTARKAPARKAGGQVLPPIPGTEAGDPTAGVEELPAEDPPPKKAGRPKAEWA